MSRRVNFINNILVMAFTLAGIFAVVLIANDKFSATLGTVLLYFVISAVIAGFICTLFHEVGHLIAGKINGFALISMTVWFFRWSKVRGKITFGFVMMGDEAGYTEMVAKTPDNLAEKLKKMTLGGLVATAIPMLAGIISFFFISKLSLFAFALWSMFLPIGIYAFLDNALPMSSGGAGNDGKVLYGLRKKDDDAKVVLSMLAVQSELFSAWTA